MSPFVRDSYDRDEIEHIGERVRTWGVWGSDDELGAANHVTPERIAAAARLIRRGAVFPLAVPMDASGPQRGRWRCNPQHVMLSLPGDGLHGEADPQEFADDAVYMPLQCSTQWDALAHVYYAGRGYNGREANTVTARLGARFNSITNFADRAVGRGVLLDMPRSVGCEWLMSGQAIQAEDLQLCAKQTGTAIGPGDFVLIRTGHMAAKRRAGDWGDYAGGDAPGLGVSGAEFLCARGIAAVVTDTWGLEVRPPECSAMLAPVHAILLVNAGVYIGEIWDMEALADDCEKDDIHEFFLSAPPLPISGAVGSPINPIAIK